MRDRNRRAISVGLTVVTAALVLFRGLPKGVTGLRQLAAEVEAKRALLDRSRAAIERNQVLQDSAAAVKRRFEVLPAELLAGGSDASALARLGARLDLHAAKAGVQLVELSAVADSTSVYRLRRVSLRVSIDSDLPSLFRWLKQLRSDGTAIGITDLKIAAQHGLGSGEAERLRTDLILYGWYALPGASEADSARGS